MKRNMMRTVPRILTLAFLVALGVFILHGNSSRWRCHRNLMLIDHAINCHATVQMETEEGNIDEEGNWITNQWYAMLGDDRTHCPKSGLEYILPRLKVGIHPSCPTHGDLIRFYGSVPHHQTRRSAFWWFAPPVCALGAVVFGIWTLISVVIAKRKKKREDHNNYLNPIENGAPFSKG